MIRVVFLLRSLSAGFSFLPDDAVEEDDDDDDEAPEAMVPAVGSLVAELRAAVISMLN